MPKVGDLIRWAEDRLQAGGVPSARLDAELLLAGALGMERTYLLARQKEQVPVEARERFARLVESRRHRVPVAYLLGSREFWSLDFEVNEHVLIPRPETETVVESALRMARRLQDGAGELLVADVGTGAGPIAVALAREIPSAIVHATEISGAALEVARRNASRHGVSERIVFHRGDLLEPLMEAGLEGRLDLVVCNPPYVGLSEPVQEEVRRWEPREAVYSGKTGEEIIRRLIPQAAPALRDGGALVMEITLAREKLVRNLLGEDPCWEEVAVGADLAGLPRVVTAVRARRVS